LTYSQSKTK